MDSQEKKDLRKVLIAAEPVDGVEMMCSCT